MNGFINLLKPAGMTSHDAVNSVRRIIGIKKVGHTGTLDPMASGVLPICIGPATRAAEYLEADVKSYRCELKLGTVTDTGDIWGNVLERRAVPDDLTEEDVRTALESMRGEQSQYPPMYSAIRVNGKRLYEYARKGEEVKVEPRRIFIYDIKVAGVFYEPGRVMFDVTCSKGTYVRTICTDLGNALGCGAAMSCLIRTGSGRFDISDSVTLEELLEAASRDSGLSGDEVMAARREGISGGAVSEMIMPMDRMLSGFGSIVLSDAEKMKYCNGGKIAFRNALRRADNTIGEGNRFSDMYLVYGEDGGFVGTAVADAGKRIYTVGKVFVR